MSKYVSREKACERSRLWYQKNRKVALQKRRAYRHKHRQATVAYSVTWRYTSKERYASSLWSSCKLRAKKKQIPFTIEKTDITIPDVCPVLGIPLEIKRGGRHNGTPTIDRIKPELGYVKANIRVISWRANNLKNNATLEELQAIIKYMAV